ncbi:hypothetical protein TRFO_38042 [Tritrichomonas foetus]|uniref:Uncharacterized protein n=1 Tax=Tritrichomonas foetus TaxID=1144522 RepID=A0A1J4JDR7_9EUKA|nr:hypothetical protein TRFO_38042 [Tritrichomonas foetus]|eukprot:OHS95819.1 hypothetical protein TRFO_38042 [Tritrichomonas foetus]
MHTTLATIETEFQDDIIPNNNEFMEDLTATEYFAYLRRIYKKADFKDSVLEFVKKEKIEVEKKKQKFTDSANRLKYIMQLSAQKRRQMKNSSPNESLKINLNETPRMDSRMQSITPQFQKPAMTPFRNTKT